MPIRQQPKRLLLVEGRDDEHVLRQVSRHHGFNMERGHEDFAIEPKEGVDNLLDVLKAYVMLGEVEHLGLVLDADLNLEGRWQTLSSVLSPLGYVVPGRPAPQGTILQRGMQPTVGIWVMPDNQVPGILEDFIRTMVPAGDAMWAHAVASVDRVPESSRRFAPKDTAKALIHTWLAWQKDPGTPLGLAVRKAYLKADTPEVENLVQWLRALFAA